MLVSAAATAWGVPAGEIKAESGRLLHASGKSASYGEMALAGVTATPPAWKLLAISDMYAQMRFDVMSFGEPVLPASRHAFDASV